MTTPACPRCRRFDVPSVQDVRLEDLPGRGNEGASRTHIVIQTREGKQIKCGSMLNEERRKFVAAAVRKALVR